MLVQRIWKFNVHSVGHMNFCRLTLVTALIALAGCTSSTLRVRGLAPVAGWVAERSINIQREYFCGGVLEREERSAKTFTENGFSSIDVEYNCYR